MCLIEFTSITAADGCSHWWYPPGHVFNRARHYVCSCGILDSNKFGHFARWVLVSTNRIFRLKETDHSWHNFSGVGCAARRFFLLELSTCFWVLLVSCQAISTAFAPHFVAVVCSRDVRPYTFCYMMLYVWETYLANELVQNMDCVRMFFHFSDVVSCKVYSTL